MGISQAVNYCIIDSERCQNLLIASNALSDKREFAAISYTSLFESFYRADGIRVYNLVMGYACMKEWNLACSSNFKQKITIKNILVLMLLLQKKDYIEILKLQNIKDY